MAISFLTGIGYLCRHTRRTGFKLALVVGYSGDKMRVRYWRAASRKWTLPTPVDSDHLDHLLSADRAKHAKMIERATKVAVDLKLTVKVWS